MTRKFFSLAVLALIASAGPALAICDAKMETQTPISRYDINGAEVTDKKTGLTWARCSVGQLWQDKKGCVGVVKEMPWIEAKHTAGNGWRLPTKDELGTLTTAACRHPAVNEEAFPTMNPEKLAYWSSTPFGADYAMAVHFADIDNAYGFYSGKALAVRLVKDGGEK